MTEEKVRAVLRDFGVTEKEIEIYLFLAKHGVMKGGEISKKAKTHKALVYRILSSLQSKGLVTPTLESPARFAAVNFETIIDLNIESKRDEAALLEKTKKELLSYWQNISKIAAESALEKFVVIEGSKKIYLKISQMINETKSQFSAVTTVQSLVRAEQHGILETALAHQQRSKVQFRFLTELNQQNIGEAQFLINKAVKSGFEFKARNPDLGLRLPSRMIIRDNQEILFFLKGEGSLNNQEENDSCLWTNSITLVQAFRNVFEDSWIKAINVTANMKNVDSRKLKGKSYGIADAETAKRKFNAIINSAKKEVIVMTSAKGLVAIVKDETMLKHLAKKGVNPRIMAPIVNENLEAAEQLSRDYSLRHIPLSYLGAVIIDRKYIFQFNQPDPDKEETITWPSFEKMFYADDPRYVKRIAAILNNVWKDATPTSSVTLESLTPNSPLAIEKNLTKHAPNQMWSSRRSTGRAIIYPPSSFNMPSMIIEVHQYKPQSVFGGGNTLEVYLRLQTPIGLGYVPVAVLETNSNSELVLGYKKIYAGTPAAQNIQVIKPGQLHARLTSKKFFAAWTVNIPLPPTSYSLPASVMMLESYGNIKNKTYTWPFPSGFKAMIDWTGYDAFVTFLDPTWKYAGPSTQGMIGKDVAITAIPP